MFSETGCSWIYNGDNGYIYRKDGFKWEEVMVRLGLNVNENENMMGLVENNELVCVEKSS